MNISVRQQGGKARVVLKGRFDFSSRHDFREACDDALSGSPDTDVVVDLRDLDYLDSAALGMLLLLNDRGRAAGKTISLAARPGVVCDVLRVAKFDALFAFDVQ